MADYHHQVKYFQNDEHSIRNVVRPQSLVNQHIANIDFRYSQKDSCSQKLNIVVLANPTDSHQDSDDYIEDRPFEEIRKPNKSVDNINNHIGNQEAKNRIGDESIDGRKANICKAIEEKESNGQEQKRSQSQIKSSCFVFFSLDVVYHFYYFQGNYYQFSLILCNEQYEEKWPWVTLQNNGHGPVTLQNPPTQNEHMQKYIWFGIYNQKSIRANNLMNNQDSRNSGNRILPIAIASIDSIIEASMRKSFSMQILCIVARLISKKDEIILSDETGIFRYQLKNTQRDLVLEQGHYYECLGILKNYNMSFIVQIVNIKEVDSNYIALHMMRIMKNGFNNKIIDYNHCEQTVDRGSSQKKEQVYVDMKVWCEQKAQFTPEQLYQEFGKCGKQTYETALQKIEDEELVANLGQYYRWIA